MPAFSAGTTASAHTPPDALPACAAPTVHAPSCGHTPTGPRATTAPIAASPPASGCAEDAALPSAAVRASCGFKYRAGSIGRGRRMVVGLSGSSLYASSGTAGYSPADVPPLSSDQLDSRSVNLPVLRAPSSVVFSAERAEDCLMPALQAFYYIHIWPGMPCVPFVERRNTNPAVYRRASPSLSVELFVGVVQIVNAVEVHGTRLVYLDPLPFVR